jgi:hypothetical protein
MSLTKIVPPRTIVLTDDFDAEFSQLMKALEGQKGAAIVAQLHASWIVLKGLWTQARIWYDPMTGAEYQHERDIPPELRAVVSSRRIYDTQREFLRDMEQFGLRYSTFWKRHKPIERGIAIWEKAHGERMDAEELLDLVRRTLLSPSSAETAQDAVFEFGKDDITRESIVVGVRSEAAKRLPSLTDVDLPQDLDERIQLATEAYESYITPLQQGLDEAQQLPRQAMRDIKRTLLRKPAISAYYDYDLHHFGMYVEFPEGSGENWTVRVPERFTIKIYNEKGEEVTDILEPEVDAWFRKRLKITG